MKEEKISPKMSDISNISTPHVSIESEEVEVYGDRSIASYHGKVPKFLIANYIFWPLWGIVTLIYFWNGSRGPMDPGYWHELQVAANTTFPVENQESVARQKKSREEGLLPITQGVDHGR